MNANRLERANHKWWTLAAMCFALFMIMLDNTVVNVALPSIQRDLNTTPENLEWTINAYFLSFAALILLGGKLGDRFGRKKIFLVGLAIFTLSSAACALSTSDTGLIAARVVAGRRRRAYQPALALDHRGRIPAQPGADRNRHLGRHLGPRARRRAAARRLPRRARRLVGRLLDQRADRRAGRGRDALGGAESRDPNARGFDIVGTLLVTGGLFALVWALIRTNSHSWSSGQTIGFLVCGSRAADRLRDRGKPASPTR